MVKKLLHNPYLIFLPFLLFYSYTIFLNKWPSLYGDEIRYVEFAHHLIHGYYSPPSPHINLWNGPGYPIVLLPFIALRIPVIYITLLNAVFLYLTVVFLYKAVYQISNRRTATLSALLLAVYPNDHATLPILYTEAFTSFLIAAFVYALTLYYRKTNRKYLITAGLVLGYLTLTKIIFGYVLVICLVVCLVMFLFKKNKAWCFNQIYILLLALAVTIPYLAYTWSVTGKVFYWGNSGGMSLYWMSTPYEHEYGDWKVPSLSNKQYPALFKSSEAVGMLKNNHSKEIKFILKHNDLEQDELFKKIAIANIKKHPLKFIQNYYYNVSRMLFNFPYSYAYQDAAVVQNIVIGSLILWSSTICLILTIVNWEKIVFPVKFLMLITGVYLLLSGALSSYPRQFDIIVPVLLFWMSYLIHRLKKNRLQVYGTRRVGGN